MRTIHLGVLATTGPTAPDALDHLRASGRPTCLDAGGIVFEFEDPFETDSFNEWGTSTTDPDGYTEGDPIRLTYVYGTDWHDDGEPTERLSREAITGLRGALTSVLPAGHRLADYVVDTDGADHSLDSHIVPVWG